MIVTPPLRRISPAHADGMQTADRLGERRQLESERPRRGQPRKDVVNVVAPGERGFEPAALYAETNPAGAQIDDIVGADIGRPLDAERDRAARVRRAEGGNPFVVRVERRRAAGVERFDQLPFRRGHAGDRIEVAHVGRADVGHDADVGLRNLGQAANFSGVVHAQFEHGDPRAVFDPQNRKRQPQFVVQIAGRLRDGEGFAQQSGSDFLGCRLAVASGDGNHRPAPMKPRRARQPAQRFRRIGNLNRGAAAAGPPACLDDGGDGSRGERLLDVVVAVAARPADGEEQIARAHRPRIDRIARRRRPGGVRFGVQPLSDLRQG